MNRRTLERDFVAPGPSPWKTFVVEAHAAPGSAPELLTDAFGPKGVSSTDDVHLHSIALDDDLRFVVDDLDGRFWSFHTRGPADQASRALKRRITTRRDLDHVWLPSHHLRQVRPGSRPTSLSTAFSGWDVLPSEDVHDLSITVRGGGSDHLLDLIRSEKGHGHAVTVDHLAVRAEDPDLGHVDEAVNRHAYFVAKGDSFALHQDVVAGVISRYRAFVEAAERRAITFTAFGEDGGGSLAGAPIEIRFSRPIPALPAFLDRLFSSREPFRLWGFHRADERYGECEAVDLHVGQCIRIEAQPDMLRIHLGRGGCGNTVARLVSNLQHHIDGALWMQDPDLDALLKLELVHSLA